MFRIPSRLILVALVAFAFPFGAKAGPIVGATSGVFVNPFPGSNENPVFDGVGTSHFEWGIPTLETNPPNSLDFAARQFCVNPGQEFVVGHISYYNGTTFLGTAIAGVDLLVAIMDLEGNQIADPVVVNLSVITTPNVIGDPEASADILLFVNQIQQRFHVFEGAGATAAIYGTLVPTSIPNGPSPLQSGFSLQLTRLGNVQGGGFVTFAPEPSTFVSGAFGVLGLIVTLRRNRRVTSTPA